MCKKIAILFPGQGSQYEEMGRDIINSSIESKKIYTKLHEIVGKDTANKIIDAKISDLSKTRYAQLAIFLNSMILFEEVNKLDMFDIEVSIGLSLGEYSALCSSKMFDINTGIKVVNERGIIMTEGAAGKGTMVAVMKSDIDTIKSIIDDIKTSYDNDANQNNIEDKNHLENKEKGLLLSICNLNSPAQIVVGGGFDAIDIFEKECKNRGIKKVIRLDVEGPFHTEILYSSAEKFGKILEEVEFDIPSFDVYSNYDAKSYKNIAADKEKIISVLKKQMYSPVLFEECIKKIIDKKVDTFVEIGPGKSLSGFIKKIDKSCKVYNVQTLDDIEKLKNEFEQ